MSEILPSENTQDTAKQKQNTNPNRNQAGINLHQSEVDLQQLIEYTPVAIAILDREMRYLAVSHKWLEDYSQTNDIIGHSLYEIFPDIPPEWKSFHQECLAGATKQCDEYPYPQADGSLQWLRWSIRPWYMTSGEIGGITIFSENITERKQAQLALQQSEERYRYLLAATSVLFWVFSPDGIVVDDNPSWREFTGQSWEEYQGRGWLDAIHPEDRQLIAQSWEEAVKTSSLYEQEFRLRRHDGEYRYTLARGVPVLEPDGSIREWLGTNTDITEGKQAQVALQQSEERFRSLLEASSQIIWTTDAKGAFITDQAQWRVFTGQTVEESLGWGWINMIHPEDLAHTNEAWSAAVANRSVYEVETRIQRYDGEYRYFSSRAVPLFNPDNSFREWVGANTDITERKLFEFALAQAKEAAEAASHAKSEFLANMSHELRTPLNGILGYAQILQRSKHLNEDERSRIDVIYQCGSHLLTLINDILDLSKIEAQKVELMTSDFHFPAFLQGVAEMCRIRAELKGIGFRHQLALELPIAIRADEKRLRQVLINLLSNAIKFTDAGSVTFTISYASEGKIRFEVRDSGIGIPAEKLQAIFQPFEQAGDRRRQIEGTGLGLAISQRIVELMGSTIQVQSDMGVGSIFWFEVHLPEADEWVKTSQADDYGQIIGIKDRKPKILVVDDKWENRSVINNLLTPIGFDVCEANDGEEGWQKILEFQPELVITDLLMPKLDGFELIKCIRESETYKEIIIIVSSASVFESDQHRSIEAGGNDFMPKPVQAITLFQKLRHFLNLDWVYEHKNPENLLNQENAELILPPQSEIEILYELVMKGNFKGIIKQAALISEMDGKYIHFAKHLHQLAKGFQDQEILALLQSHK
ncbi:MAG: PAS domain S-box protein [Nostoc sp. DedQUE11]|nr:PAS domain S-box protein [Nostoc sp. DedQUE11]